MILFGIDLNDDQPLEHVFVLPRSRSADQRGPIINNRHCLFPEPLILGRRHVDQVKDLVCLFEKREGIPISHLGPIHKPGHLQVLPDGQGGLASTIIEGAELGPLAQRFDSHAPASREEVKNVHPFKPGAKNIK